MRVAVFAVFILGFSGAVQAHSQAMQVSALLASADTGDTLDPWLATHVAHSTQVMLSNIGPSPAMPKIHPGAVVAAPSDSPNYRYHWIRDGALTMDTVLGLYQRAAGASEQNHYLDILFAYADFSRLNQQTLNPSGEADGTGLGEPKFNLDGSAFTAPWGRPQNDGPALRASTLSRLCQLLLDQGQESLVRSKFYSGGLPARTVIKADLEYVSHHWQDASFDLWEEVRGKHFYTQMVQRRALIEGANLAERLGDSGAASFYRVQARGLEGAITAHWDASKKQINATLERTDGIEKPSGLDVAVVLGALHGAVHAKFNAADAVDPFFAVTDERVLATVLKIDEAFHRIYWINGQDRDPANLPLGNAIGRYPEDHYSGEGPVNLGNPWFLATAAFAEFYYRSAQAFEQSGLIRITALNAPFFARLRPVTGRLVAVKAGELIRSGSDPRFSALVQSLRDTGDSYLRRIELHADPSGALSEQFNRDTGYMQSAAELTWSHASLLTADWARAH